MLDELSIELLEPFEVDTQLLRPLCATCAAEDLLHVVRTPLGFGCPWTNCLQFVAGS